jgi:hypothetical protein
MMLNLRWDSKKDRYFLAADNGRLLGEIVGKTYITPRTVNHFFKKFSGFGISMEVVDELLVLGTQFVIFDYFGKEGRVMYRTRLTDIIRDGVIWVDESWGKPDRQLIYPAKEMEVIKGRD